MISHSKSICAVNQPSFVRIKDSIFAGCFCPIDYFYDNEALKYNAWEPSQIDCL